MRKSRKLRKSLLGVVLLGLSLIVLQSFTDRTDAQNRVKMERSVQNMSDEELVRALSSRDKDESYRVANEIMNRGDRMIPLLFSNKGNRAPFALGNLGIQESSFIFYLPSGNEEWDYGRIVTVEVASIYLVSALFHQKLEFAYTTYLRSKDGVDDSKYNTNERVQKAWSYSENWLKRMKAEGLQSLREHGIEPLGGSGLFF